ncbi:D-alanyl-D-alanine carboxypeptidase family protein [Kitasatospora sp. NBC_01302]|uniref:D-alanyl-D-alanine carboxypeptidase family protein n=1 Tax=Kitasatospora sp. NBC_01302 TaxID=2903575 RepID=UPI002E138376|nr:D-alanyl-D-alanine carboxypeptidase [Kitasatospora sp. NBC_01302]
MGDAPEKVQDGEREQPVGAEAAPTTGQRVPPKSGPTVQLRVREVDTRTTFLRLPEPEPETPATEETEAEDPRLAIRTDDETDGAAAETDGASAEAPAPAPAAVEPAPEPADAPAPEPVPAPEPTLTLKAKAAPEPTLSLKAKAAPEPTLTLKAKAKAAPAPEPAPAAEPAPAPAVVAPPTPAPPTPAPPPAPAALAVGSTPPPPSGVFPPLPPAPAPAPPAPEAGPGPVAPESAPEAVAALAAQGGQAGPKPPLARRVLRRATVWTVLLALLAGAAAVAQLLRPLPKPQLRMTATGSFTFAGAPPALPWPAKGQAAAEVFGVGSLGSSGPETPVPIASVTKVMNAYLILQAHPLKKGESGPTITVDKAAATESGDADQSTAKVTEGQQISEYEALEMLMLPSANNIARLLARWDSGSEDAFVKKMNDQAAKFQMGNTRYADAAGYSNDTKSTAKDQLKLAEVVMQNAIFQQIVAEPDSTIAGTKILNTNALLNKNGVIGVKTGSSTPAGSCLMWAAVKDVAGSRQMLLGVTLGQPPTATDNIIKAAQTVSSKIITAGQAALTGQTLAKQGDVVGYVDDGMGGQVPVVATKDVAVPGFTGISTTLQLTGLPGGLGHNAAAGTTVGTLTAGSGPTRVQVPVALQHDLAPPSIMSRLTRTG